MNAPIPLPSDPRREPTAGGVREWFFRVVPAFDSLRSYSWQALGADAMAGLTVATVAVPQAMAYATIAGLPAQYGLYTAIVMTAVGALLDSSRQLINGPTNAISIALLSSLALVPEGQRIPAAVLLAFLVGAFQLGIAFLRLGDLTRYISHSVILGFTVGAGVLLVLDQTKHLLGLRARGAAGDHFLKRFWLTLTSGGGIHWTTCAIGVGTILVVLAVRWLNGLRRARGARFPIPQHLVAVILMAALVWAFRLDQAQDVAVVGPIPAGLPRFELPQLHWEGVRLLSGNAFAIAVLGLLEAVAMAKSIAAVTGQKLDINQQCLSEGAANMAGSFFQCFPGSGSLTRSAVNQQAGAVSQWSGVFSAAAVAATVLLFGPLAQYIPRAALAGLLMLAAFRMVDRNQLAFHLRATRADAGIILATALAAVFISVEFCILIGTFLSFVLYVPRAARLHAAELTITPERVVRERVTGDPLCSKILIYDLEGELFFGSAPDLERLLSALEARVEAGGRVVVLRLKRVRNPDGVCLRLLTDFVDDMDFRKVPVLMCGVRREMAIALRATGLEARLGPQRMFHEAPSVWSSTLDAVRQAYELLGDDLCAACPRRTGPGTGREAWYYMI